MRKNFSLLLKVFILISVLLGMIFSFINYEYDGYSDWYKRLLYFTTQSGILIFISSLLIIILNLKKTPTAKKTLDRVYLLRYVFTVSISVTGVVFCGLLAPFADSAYHPWSYFSILNHVVTPILAIADFFVDEYRVSLRKIDLFYSVTPPLIYFIFCAILSAFKVDFGRGDPYPYFFMDLNSPAGFFGISKEDMAIGTFWWLLLFLLFVLSLGKIYSTLNNSITKDKNQNRP